MRKAVLSLCDVTGIAVRPWADAGYDCFCVDIQHPEGFGLLKNGVRKVGSDVREFEPPTSYEWVFAFAFPPCTHLATSGRAWFKAKGLELLAESIQLVAACARICESLGCPYLIENPIGTLSTYWRKPDYLFDPCDYAGYLAEPEQEAFTKRTCLWVGDGFVMPEKRHVEPTQGSKMHLLPESANRAMLRSVTPAGFSKAIYYANRPLVARQGQPG